MLEIKYIRKNFSSVEAALAARGVDIDLSGLKIAEQARRKSLQSLEALRHERNRVSDQIAIMKKAGDKAQKAIAEMRAVGEHIKVLEADLARYQQVVDETLMEIPNLPHASVPIGKDENDNTLVKEEGTPPGFDFEPKAHWDIGKDLGILDFERAARITGARFPLYLKAGARLERALINFMLDIHTQEHGYSEVLPPFIVNRDSMTHTGQLPKFEDDLFKLEGWDYFLVPTAEVPVTNIHHDEILDEVQLPVLYTAYTPCFRSEAGSHGRDTRGLTVSYTHLTLPTTCNLCRSRWSPYH